MEDLSDMATPVSKPEKKPFNWYGFFGILLSSLGFTIRIIPILIGVMFIAFVLTDPSKLTWKTWVVAVLTYMAYGLGALIEMFGDYMVKEKKP